jgi:hypothetical protein
MPPEGELMKDQGSATPTDKGDALESDEWSTSATPEAVTPAWSETAFTPGTMLAGRYRVVAPLGRGGMGEVYRADDTKLGHPVALKFIRGVLSPELLERLYSEVRIGRQVSHPSVCRLYDVVEVDGQRFLAMEYVDGEDLASLLARIGRLPGDKAADIARDLCAGLAAMHDRGIVHRDLKPANVMIDGRGRARITDFGLAVTLAAPGTHGFAGTPAYMSPEQLSGSEVTPRADLYAFGLVTYEMLTGRRFYEAKTLDELSQQHREPKTPRLASVSRVADPRLERVVQQCLHENAEARPPSARAVLLSLPGGDPLEAAVAAGDTPSPEVVAAAATVGDLSRAMAWAGLVATLCGMALVAWLYDRAEFYHTRMLPKPAPVLAERAREVLDRLGHAKVADTAQAFEWDRTYFAHVLRTDPSPDRWIRLGKAPLLPVSFFYRQSPRHLLAGHRDAMVRREDPPLDVPGMREVVLDPRGRLLTLVAVPPRIEPVRAWPEPDWRPLFEEAGLDAGRFRQVPPQWTAPVDSDRKAAWEGPYPGEPALPVRIEAAAYHGSPVWFAVLPPWAAEATPRSAATAPTPFGQASLVVLALAIPIGGVLLARRNLQLGRGDRQGAFRVALFVFLAYTAAGLLRADHVATFGEELWILIRVVAYPCFWAVQVWLLYMALEPYVRRRWPHMLISWKRVLAGRLRDPMVGRDVLFGAGMGSMMVVCYVMATSGPFLFGQAPVSPGPFLDGTVLSSLRQATYRVFVNQFSAVLFAMVFLFVFTLLRMLVRRQWLAALLWCVLVSTPMLSQTPALEWTGGVVRSIFMLVVLLRGGLLALVVALYFVFILLEMPMTLDLSAWYAAHALPVVSVMALLAVYGFHTSLGGKPALGGGLIED